MEMEWQPINTAPHDTRILLATRTGTGSVRVVIGSSPDSRACASPAAPAEASSASTRGSTRRRRRMGAFRFDPDAHEYTDAVTGEVFPHITGLIVRAGLTDPRWYTEESRDRGTWVHQTTAAYDLGMLPDPSAVIGRWAGWFQAYVAALKLIRPSWVDIERPLVHPSLRYAGRPDRVCVIVGVKGVLEIKTGAPERKAHRVQTALQAGLVAECGIPAWGIKRWCLYLKSNGKFVLEEHPDRADFVKAQEIVRDYR